MKIVLLNCIKLPLPGYYYDVDEDRPVSMKYVGEPHNIPETGNCLKFFNKCMIYHIPRVEVDKWLKPELEKAEVTPVILESWIETYEGAVKAHEVAMKVASNIVDRRTHPSSSYFVEKDCWHRWNIKRHANGLYGDFG